ncbi:histone-fold-containing protein [Phlyctochytrium arcticum]|nr:histone-fold-containing protein [Phlyctochytrium arcticum]
MPDSGAGSSHDGGAGSDNDDFREQDRFLPVANVARLMKRALPENSKIAKEAKDCIMECVSEFISFITSEATDRCISEKRKTINGEDILWAMQSLGFDNYCQTMKAYLHRYRQSMKMDRANSIPASKLLDASSHADSGTTSVDESDQTAANQDMINQVALAFGLYQQQQILQQQAAAAVIDHSHSSSSTSDHSQQIQQSQQQIQQPRHQHQSQSNSSAPTSSQHLHQQQQQHQQHQQHQQQLHSHQQQLLQPQNEQIPQNATDQAQLALTPQQLQALAAHFANAS